MRSRKEAVWIIAASLLTVTIIVSANQFQNAYAASAPSTQWTKTFGGTGNDGAYYVNQTTDGGYALAGFYNTVLNQHAFYFIKTDSSGTVQFNKTYGGEVGIDDAYCVIQTSDGGYAMTGFTNSSGAGGYDGWLVKLDSAGNMQWNQTYGGATADDLYVVIQTSDGGYVMVGYTTSFGAGQADSHLIKVDSSGNVVWDYAYGGTGVDDTTAMTQTSDGGFALAGFTDSSGAGGRDGWLVKVASNGTLEWNKTYGGAADDAIRSVVQTSDGGYALAGITGSYGSGGADAWLVKIDASGDMQWNKTYGGADYDSAISIAKTSDGGFVLAGSTTSSGAGNNDVWVIRTDSSGNAVWNQTYGGTGADYAYSIIQTSDGGFAVAGNTASFPVAGGTDVYFIKLAAETPENTPTPSPTSTPTPSPGGGGGGSGGSTSGSGSSTTSKTPSPEPTLSPTPEETSLPPTTTTPTGEPETTNITFDFVSLGGVAIGVTAVSVAGASVAVLAKKRKPSETKLRGMPYSQFQDWVLKRLGGRRASAEEAMLGINGFTFDGKPVMIEQSSRVGMEAVDKFASSLSQKRSVGGVIVAFGFENDAIRTKVKAKMKYRLDIELLTVAELLYLKS